MKHINDYHIKVNVHYFKPYDKKNTDPLDKALGKFSKKIKLSGLLLEMHEREFFISKSEKKRKAKRIGKFRRQNERT